MPDIGLNWLSKIKKRTVSTIFDINTIEDFEYLLSVYIKLGLSHEQYILDESVFNTLKKAGWKKAIYTDLGGIGARMSKVAYQENCDLLLGMRINRSFLKTIFGNSDKVK